MADLNDLQRRLQKVRQEILNSLPDLSRLNTITAKALIERKIRQQGFGAMYSGNKLPAWFFDGKEKSNAGAAYIESVKKKDEAAKDGEETGMTWADLRRAEGLPTDHVDLGFTNKMWAGMGPQTPYYKGEGQIVCPLGGNSAEVVNKMNWNRDRYGDYLGKSLGPEEIKILTQVMLEQIQLIFKNNGF
jgi:hypothetical protein